MRTLITPDQVACEFQFQLANALQCSPLRGEMNFAHVSTGKGIRVAVSSLGAVAIIEASGFELALGIEDFSDRCVKPCIDQLMHRSH